ncbi:hypothetical protein PENANT_c027G00452 [Penicillium antarcticum]|uniref:Uncharacterized protein n=1 Tax=Penicillium antarcticum TaxID=416450 RepID=A0A1V6PWP0_9EURO|nr:uncharacterized protein N7508_003226 [Penicillium antarcticum]KAJ5312396.1 hypothetical protein N7508_003226 [Penicillium antarcticum]OQD81438.1 hypothetical protein PENANT_c027G00452 [Penicillium antarcticum]
MINWQLAVSFKNDWVFLDNGTGIPEKIEDVFVKAGVSNLGDIISEASFPPTYISSFTTNDDVTKEELEETARKGLPEGFTIDINPRGN